MDFSLLYDKEHQIFSIGFNMEENKLTDLTTQQSLKIPISNGKKAIFTFNISYL